MKKLIAAILSLLMLLSAFAGVADEWVDITEFVESGEETTEKEPSGEEPSGEETTEKETTGEETTEKETTEKEVSGEETTGEETTEKETTKKMTPQKKEPAEKESEDVLPGNAVEETTDAPETETYTFAVLNEEGEAIPYEIAADGETVVLTAAVGEDGYIKIILPRAMAEEWLATGKTGFVYTNGSYSVTLDIARLAEIAYEAASLSIDTAPVISFEENQRTNGMLSAARIRFCGILKGEEKDISWNMAGTISYTCPVGNSCPGLRQITRINAADKMNRTKIAFTLDIKGGTFTLVTEALSSVLYIVIPETRDNLTLSPDFATSGKCAVGDTIGGTVMLKELRNGIFSVKVYVNGILVDILRDIVDYKLPFSMKVTEDNVEDGYMKITLLFFDGTLDSSRNAVLNLSYRVTEKQNDK